MNAPRDAHGASVALCQWPGCQRVKRPGKGRRYCLPHELVGTVREVRRKRVAAKDSRERAKDERRRAAVGGAPPTRAHAGMGAREDDAQERERMREYRKVLHEFGLK